MNKIWILIASFLLFLSACAKTTTSLEIETPKITFESEKRYEKRYVLLPGDVINIMVYRSPELSLTSTIKNDGYLSLPLLDEIKAGGLTVPELDDNITSLLSKRLRNPEVSIVVTNPREPMAYVVGEVERPGPVNLRANSTAAQAIANTGGMKHAAAKDMVALIRLDSKNRLVAHVFEGATDGQPAFYMALQSTVLQPDDLIFVPESNRAQFIRFVNDFINTPFSGLNQMLTPYFQFKLINELDKN